MKEATGTSLVKSKSSNSSNNKLKKVREGNMSTINVGSKESKKRGVYVEKWESPKQFEAEEIKRQPEERAQSRPRPETRTTTSLADTSKILTSNRALVAPNTGQTKLRKSPKKVSSPTTKFPKQTSNNPNKTKQPVKNRCKVNDTPPKKPSTDIKTQRNIIEENKTKVVKMKFRSNALRQTRAKDSEKVITLKSRKGITETPSGASKLTRNLSMSDHVHWSNIFPSDPQNNTNKNRLQEYIDNKLSVSKCVLKNNDMGINEIAFDEATAESNEKDEQIYKFFKDLLDTVYDENIDNNKITMVHSRHSSTSSNIQLEIDENVAQKLYRKKLNDQDYNNTEKQSNRSKFKEQNDSFDQHQQLADYYNLRTTLLTSKRLPLIPQKTTKNQKKSRNPKTEEINWKKPKKQNLLKLLKEQLSKNCNLYDEPENMYQALRALARRKCKRQICFDTPEKEPKSDSNRICRFQRRNVISRSTGLPRKKNGEQSYIATERYFFESDSSTTIRESNHTLEVFSFDNDVTEETSDIENVVKNTKSFMNLYQGIRSQNIGKSR